MRNSTSLCAALIGNPRYDSGRTHPYHPKRARFSFFVVPKYRVALCLRYAITLKREPERELLVVVPNNPWVTCDCMAEV